MGACLAVELASEDERQLRQNEPPASKRDDVTPNTLVVDVEIARYYQEFTRLQTYP